MTPYADVIGPSHHPHINNQEHAMTGLARGHRRMKEIGSERKARSDVIVTELLATLSRQPTPIDRATALAIADATVRLESKIAQGRDTATARRALYEAIAMSPFAAREAATQ